MKNYSIIIPHKNTPDLLRRSLNSIPKRKDVEIIIVDDNSDSEKVDFENFPGKNEKDVLVVFDKAGKGAGNARNVGIEHSSGKWLVFLDSDDYFNYCINDIFEEYVNAEEDIIFFNASGVDSDTYIYDKERVAVLNNFISEYFKQEDAGTERELPIRYGFGVPVAKLIKRELIVKNNIRYDDVCVQEDTMFALNIGWCAKKIAVDKRAGYCVTTRAQSRSVLVSEEKQLTSISVSGRAEMFFRERNLPIYMKTHYLMLNDFLKNNKTLYQKSIQVLKDVGLNDKQIKEGIKRIKKEKSFKKLKGRLRKLKKLIFFDFVCANLAE